MENASKALIISGAILLAVMLVSLGVFIFKGMSSSAKDAVNMDKEQIKAFNSKITPYLGNKVSGSQVNALIQYVISNDSQCIKTGERYKAITITFPGGRISAGDTGLDTSGSKRVETGASKSYIVEGNYDDNGLITTITVKNP